MDVFDLYHQKATVKLCCLVFNGFSTPVVILLNASSRKAQLRCEKIIRYGNML